MKTYTLVNSNTRKPIQIGDSVITFRGEVGKLAGTQVPRHAGSTGRVIIEFDAEGNMGGTFYPSVIGAEWEVR
jgi:hypothetical protein